MNGSKWHSSEEKETGLRCEEQMRGFFPCRKMSREFSKEIEEGIEMRVGREVE